MLRFCIEKNLPDVLRLKNANRYVVEGWIFGSERIKKILIRIGNNTYEAGAFEICRPDVYAIYRDVDPDKVSLFSGFIVPVILHPVSAEKVCSVQMVVYFRGGGKEIKTIGSVSLAPWHPVCEEYRLPGNVDKNNLLVICMATYNPKRQQFERQVESIVNQDYENWICIVNDDCSSVAKKRYIKEVVSADERFFFFENPVNLGFYHNFEKCLERVPAYAKYVALADQDDFWYPDKLRRCIEAVKGSIQLVYCDMKIVDESGEVKAATFWNTRKNYYQSKDIDLLCIKNTVTGAASVFRASLLDIVLPFPQRSGNVFHDHWIAVVAAASGGIEYIDDALYEYVQSDVNVIGYFDLIEKKHYQYLDIIKLTEPESRYINSLTFFKQQSTKLQMRINKLVTQLSYLYGILHGRSKYIYTLAQSLAIRDVDKKYVQVANRAITFTGLIKIHCKARRNKKTLDNRDLLLPISLLINRFVKFFVIPLRTPIMRLIGRKKEKAFFTGKDSFPGQE